MPQNDSDGQLGKEIRSACEALRNASVGLFENEKKFVTGYLGLAEGLVRLDKSLALLTKDPAWRDFRGTTNALATGCFEELSSSHKTFDSFRLALGGQPAQDFSGEEFFRRRQVLEDISSLSQLLVGMKASIESRLEELNWRPEHLSALCGSQDLELLKRDGSGVSGHESSRRSATPSRDPWSRWVKVWKSLSRSGRSKVPPSTVQTDEVTESERLSTLSISTAHEDVYRTIASNPSSTLTSPRFAQTPEEVYLHDASPPTASRPIVIESTRNPKRPRPRPAQKPTQDIRLPRCPGPPPTGPLPLPPSMNSSASQSLSKSSKRPASVDLSLGYGQPTSPPPTGPLPAIPGGGQMSRSNVTGTLSSSPSPSRSSSFSAGSERTVSLSAFPMPTASTDSVNSADSPSFSLAPLSGQSATHKQKGKELYRIFPPLSPSRNPASVETSLSSSFRTGSTKDATIG